jgi:histidyl-tRNA synthetase
MTDFSAPRGTRDVLPADSPKWQYVEAKFREICGLYGFREIRTPTFEHTELFTRNLGEATDVVSKEMYTFQSRSGRSLTLRPEGTAPAIRAFVEHGLGNALPVTKLYYIGRLFRYERPQAGRYREHTQLGIEVLGSSDPGVDAEVISMAAEFFCSIGLQDFELRLNSIGCPECRPGYREALVEYLAGRVGDLCEVCKDRFEANPMRVLDCKVDKCKAVLADAPKLTDHLCEQCSVHFDAVQRYLTQLAISFVLDPKLVRGFDYYTKTAFEFVSGQLGAQNAVGGGGRYDNLVEEIGGAPTPGIGFGLGLERLMLTLEALEVDLPVRDGIDVYFAVMGDAAREAAVLLAREARAQGLSSEVDFTGRGLKAQMKTANKLNVRYAVILGDDEVNSRTATLRDMGSSEQTSIGFADLAGAIRTEGL